MIRSLFVLVVALSLGSAAHAGEGGELTPELDRIARAVHGAESSHGKDPRMWRSDVAGPQGPMQVSEKAAIDVGGGNRFDIAQNRTIGRAYLALLHQRYRNWPDAVSAYNWGIARLDQWIRAGRPSEKLVPGVAKYVSRVLHGSALCTGAAAKPGCGLQVSSFGGLPEIANRRPQSSSSRNLAKAQKLAAQLGRDTDPIR